MDKIWNIPEIQLIPLAEAHEARPVLLVTSEADWESVRGKLRLPIAGKLEPLAGTLEHWDTLIELIAALPQEVVYAVGGALAMDTAKYLAHQLTLPLVCIPTALDSDAFLTPSANIQQDGCVKTLQTEPAQMAVVDLETISAAPAGQRSRGLCNVLALATASFDWKLAEERGKNPSGKGFIQHLHDQAQATLQSAFQCAEAAGKGDPHGLRQLLDCLCMEAQLCNQAGHNRLTRGSEHYFAYAAQNLPKSGLDWPELVGQGILLAAEWQGQDLSQIEDALRAGGVPSNQLSMPEIEQIKNSLPAYCKKHKLDYGIAYEI